MASTARAEEREKQRSRAALSSRITVYGAAALILATAVALAVAGVGEVEGALTNWQALVLGIVQGLTELLPISSSGHLILVPWIADWEYLQTNEQFNQTFDVALHLGTLVAVVGYFRVELARLLAAFGRSVLHRRIADTEERVAWMAVIATFPAAFFGYFGADFIAERLGEPWQIALLLAVFGIVLWIADRGPAYRQIGDLKLRTSLAVGVAQSLALAPGVSRSGITITAGRFLGLDRDSAARFSFLLLVPVVFGASVLKGLQDMVIGELPAGWVGPFVTGILAATAAGLVAIELLLSYVRRNSYTVFVLYRLVIAVVVIALIATGVREATF